MKTILIIILVFGFPVASIRADAVLDRWDAANYGSWTVPPDPDSADPKDSGQNDALAYFGEHPKMHAGFSRLFDIGMFYALRIGFRGQPSRLYASEFAGTLKVCIEHGAPL